jgi:colanic acid/amylovoran biosynthesis glycosyltransferase
VSQYLEREVKLKSPRGMHIRHIPCSVPVPDRVVQYPVGPMRLVYVGRLTEEQKQISKVARAMCRAVREVPGTEAVIIGDGVARPAVEQILREENLGPAVRLIGPVDSEQIQEHLQEGHVLVLLSDYEGLPVAVMEAMACGLVPVCLRIPSGIPELVDDGVTGLLVNDRSDNFIAAIQQLRTEPGLWKQLSTAARQRIETGYSIDDGVNRWLELTHTLLQNTSRPVSLTIPRRFDLPPVNPALWAEDNRVPQSQRLKEALVRRLSRAWGA